MEVNWMFNMNPGEIIIRVIAVIISLTVHEYAHAVVSHAQGDRTPEQYGRLTLNPMSHIDLVGLISLFIFKFGWAKPVPISSYYYKNSRRGIILTSLAGPVSNLILAFFSMVALYAFQPESQAIQYFLLELLFMNTGLAVFNILPFPPLDGSKIFAELFGGKIAEIIYSMEGKGTFILFLLLWLDPVRQVIGILNGKVLYTLESLARLVVQ
jgi:Zn-dependent protease